MIFASGLISFVLGSIFLYGPTSSRPWERYNWSDNLGVVMILAGTFAMFVSVIILMWRVMP